MAAGLKREVAGGDDGSTGHGRSVKTRTDGPAARRDAWTQSPCCSAESDDTSADTHTHTHTRCDSYSITANNISLIVKNT